MALIDVTPKMTGYTTPSPYQVYYLGTVYFPIGQEAWRAFDKSLESFFRPSSDRATLEPLILDFGKPTKINTFSTCVYVEYNNPANATKAKFIIAGSNDNKTYTTLEEFTIKKNNTLDFYQLSQNYNYRYYSFYVKVNNYRFILYELTYYYDNTLFANPSENIKGAVYSELKKVVDKYNTSFEIEE